MSSASRIDGDYEALPQVQRADDTAQDARPPVRPAAQAPTHIKVEVDQPIRPTSSADEETPSSSGSALEHGLDVKTGERNQERHAESFIQDARPLTRPARQLPARLGVKVGMPLGPISSVDKGTSSQSTLVPVHGPDLRIGKRGQGQHPGIAAQDAYPQPRTAAHASLTSKVDVGGLSTVDPKPGADLLDAFIQEQRTADFCACPTVSGPFLSLALTQAFSSVPWSTVRLDVGYTMLLDEYAIRLQVLRTQRTPPIYWSLVLDSEQRILDRLRFWIAHGYIDEVLQQGRDLLPLRPPHRFPSGQEDCQTKAEAPSGSHSPPSHGPSAPQAQRPPPGSTAEQRTAVSDSELERQVTARRFEPEIQPTSGQEESAPIARPYGAIVQDLRRKYEDGLQAQAAASLTTASFGPASPEAEDAADDRLPPPKSSRVAHISDNTGSKQHRTDWASDEPAIKVGHQLARPNQPPKDADQSRTATTCQPTSGKTTTTILPLLDKPTTSVRTGAGDMPAGPTASAASYICSVPASSSQKYCSAAPFAPLRSASEELVAEEDVPPDIVSAPHGQSFAASTISLIVSSVLLRAHEGNEATTTIGSRGHTQDLLPARQRSPSRTLVICGHQHVSKQSRLIKLLRAPCLAALNLQSLRTPIAARSQPSVVCGSEASPNSGSPSAHKSGMLFEPPLCPAFSAKAALDHAAYADLKTKQIVFGGFGISITAAPPTPTTRASRASPARKPTARPLDLETNTQLPGKPSKKARRERKFPRPVALPQGLTPPGPTGPGPPTQPLTASVTPRGRLASMTLLRSGRRATTAVQQRHFRQSSALPDDRRRRYLDRHTAIQAERQPVRQSAQAQPRAGLSTNPTVSTFVPLTRPSPPTVALCHLSKHTRTNGLSITVATSKVWHQQAARDRHTGTDGQVHKLAHKHERHEHCVWRAQQIRRDQHEHAHLRTLAPARRRAHGQPLAHQPADEQWHRNGHAQTQVHTPTDALKTRLGPGHDLHLEVPGPSVISQRHTDQDMIADAPALHHGHVHEQQVCQRAGDGVAQRAAAAASKSLLSPSASEISEMTTIITENFHAEIPLHPATQFHELAHRHCAARQARGILL
ncbi:hypothetical protein OC844_007449, partial [Tilletia horrida]